MHALRKAPPATIATTRARLVYFLNSVISHPLDEPRPSSIPRNRSVSTCHQGAVKSCAAIARGAIDPYRVEVSPILRVVLGVNLHREAQRVGGAVDLNRDIDGVEVTRVDSQRVLDRQPGPG